jgi:hypothetical protein
MRNRANKLLRKFDQFGQFFAYLQHVLLHERYVTLVVHLLEHGYRAGGTRTLVAIKLTRRQVCIVTVILGLQDTPWNVETKLLAACITLAHHS